MAQPIEDLADALQRCLADAARSGAAEAVQELRGEVHAAREEMHAMRNDMTARLDRQDEALRLMWRQMKGNGSFPLD